MKFPSRIAQLFERSDGYPMSGQDITRAAVSFAARGDQRAADKLERGWTTLLEEFDEFDAPGNIRPLPDDERSRRRRGPAQAILLADLKKIAANDVSYSDRKRWSTKARVVLVPVFTYEDENDVGGIRYFLVPESLDAALAYAASLINEEPFRSDLYVCQRCGAPFFSSDRPRGKGGPRPTRFCSKQHMDDAAKDRAKEHVRASRLKTKAAKHK
jgi:hypothetical protein